MDFRFLTLALALAIDRVFGEADVIWRYTNHPIVWFGQLIGLGDKALNKPEKSSLARRRDGFLLILALLIFAAVAGYSLHLLFRPLGIVGTIFEALVASIFLAQKSLTDHVAAVSRGLLDGGLEGGREAVSRIVGRDPKSLDEAGVSRAAIESLAENFADGVVAPAFWFAIAGLPGLLAYKMLNTADSMIGHMNDKYRDFGRASAKLDDVANYIPARLGGLLIVLAAGARSGVKTMRRAFAVMMRDARLHRSPNSGWPEAAMAGALDLALAGPRIYNGDVANEPMLNGGGRRSAGMNDIDVALSIANLAHSAGVLTVLTLLIIA